MSREPDLFQPSLKDLDKVPAAPGHTDTSAAAAESIAYKLTGLRKVVYDAVVEAGSDGVLPGEIADAQDIWIYTVRPRLTELRKAGLVVDSGRRRKNERGKDEIVWTLPHHKDTDQ